MSDAPLLLASASPRRRRLVEWLGVACDTAVADVEEDLTGALKSIPTVLARSIAADKARAATAADGGARTVVAFDTIVVLDRQVLGKPADRDEARDMLRRLSGGTHAVITGVAVQAPGQVDPRTFAVTTPVLMADLDEAQIETWVAGDEVLGCAGAYNIERHLACVDPGECHQNVAGLPLCHVYGRLAALELPGLTSPVSACDAARGETCELGPTITTLRSAKTATT